jgi:large subunit ribosomal protein L7Ae
MVVGNDKAGDSKNSLFQKNPRNFRIGGDIVKTKDLTRFVRWPKYVRIQRQKRILMHRLKVPPTINQFQSTVDANQAGKLLKLLAKYKPETKQEKKDRLKKAAENKSAAKGPKPMNLKFGLNHVTTLVEQGKARLVIMAHDVDPIETMVHLPALCRRKQVPYCFLRGKAALGKLCHMKTATCVAITDVNREDMQDLDALSTQFKEQYNNNAKQQRQWGGGIMGIKNQHMIRAREKLREIELAKKANM